MVDNRCIIRHNAREVFYEIWKRFGTKKFKMSEIKKDIPLTVKTGDFIKWKNYGLLRPAGYVSASQSIKFWCLSAGVIEMCQELEERENENGMESRMERCR